MNTKTHSFTLTLCLLATSALVSCTTTGNPDGGGLFGWSEEKAIERRNALQSQYTASYNALQSLEQQKSRQSAEYQRLLKENKRLKAKRAAARTIREQAEVDAAIRMNEAALENM